MREKIINALDYPRCLIRDTIELDECIHSGYYAREDRVCRECDDAMLCQWLNANDECTALEEHPLKRLIDSLEFAVSFVDSRSIRSGHALRSCRCEACGWLRDARGLLEEAQGRKARIFGPSLRDAVRNAS